MSLLLDLLGVLPRRQASPPTAVARSENAADQMASTRFSQTLSPMRLSFACCVIFAVASAVAQVASPTVIPFQGRLTNQQGVPYTSGQYTLTFNLYSVAIGGATEWTERHEKVGVINGTVNVFLGSIQSIATVDFSTVKYLGITIDVDGNPLTADPEMVPRQMIIPAFHAKNAEKLAGHSWSSILVAGPNANDPANGRIRGDKIADLSVNGTSLANNTITAAKVANLAITDAKLADNSISASKLSAEAKTPPGTIVAFAGSGPAPAGWLFCWGGEVSISSYPNLAAVIGSKFGAASNPAVSFRLPDLRGYFLRGVDHGSGRDPNAGLRTAPWPGGQAGDEVGSIQGDEIRSHFHRTDGTDSGDPHLARRGFDALFDSHSSTASADDAAYVPHSKTGNTGGSETRPLNIYVHYIIKY